MGRVQNWDTHSGNFKRLKDRLLPPTDRGVSALLDDLAATGLLDETLVIVTGEFGRTPRIGATHRQRQRPGRPRPLVDGASRPPSPARGSAAARRSASPTRSAPTPPAAPTPRPTSPRRSTESLGIDPETELRDRLGRPIPLCTGPPIAPLFDGAIGLSRSAHSSPRWIRSGPVPTVFSYLPSEAFWYLVKPRRARLPSSRLAFDAPGLERQARRLEEPADGPARASGGPSAPRRPSAGRPRRSRHPRRSRGSPDRRK